ncbi:MAG TPA: type II CAAX endopeptidase family protein, partial [Pyrinomonadaceae bacterium]|nr:type II CAAX endopeptidase family protein [Pyrinomonadaceae bacterium]
EPSHDVTPLSNEPGGFGEAGREILPPPPAVTVQSPQPQPWLEVVKAFLVWAGSFALLLFTPVVLAIPYFIYSWTKYGLPRPEAIVKDKTLILLSIVGTIMAHVLTLILIWFYATGAGKRPFAKSVGFEWPKNITPGVGTLLCCLLAIVLLGIGWATTQVLGGEKTQLDLIVESSMAARFATALAAVATAPLVEELIYRGVLYSALERAAGLGVAVAVVSLLFAGIHVFQYSNNIGVILVITVLSFTLTIARAYTGSLFPPFIIHLVFNGIQSLVLVLTPFLDKSILNKDEVTPTTPGFDIALHLLEKLSVYICRMT